MIKHQFYFEDKLVDWDFVFDNFNALFNGLLMLIQPTVKHNKAPQVAFLLTDVLAFKLGEVAFGNPMLNATFLKLVLWLLFKLAD